MPYDVEAIRKKLKSQSSGKFVDPDEFRPPKVASTTESVKYRFFVLPPIKKGDKLKSGVAPRDMEYFFLKHGHHWINMKPHACPRVWDGTDCKICAFGMNLVREEKDDDAKRKIRDIWYPSNYSMVNIYFTNWEGNPQELRRKVKWYNAPKTVLDHWTAALYRDDKGDPEEPQAWGVFFDEHAGFIYQLEIVRKGKNNNYEKSHFVTSNGIPIPMVGKPGEPDEKGIQTLLRLRHNLFAKVDEPDLAEIDKMYAFLTQGDDQHVTPTGGFDHDETAPEAGPADDEETAPPADDESAPPADDDTSGSPALEEEAPITEEAASTSGESDDGESSEINALLDQLRDDD